MIVLKVISPYLSLDEIHNDVTNQTAKKLAKLLECWHDMEYDISHYNSVRYVLHAPFKNLLSFFTYKLGVCLQVLLPYHQIKHYTLYILDLGTRTNLFHLGPNVLWNGPNWVISFGYRKPQIFGGNSQVFHIIMDRSKTTIIHNLYIT